MPEAAPFFADLADGPQGAQAWWLTTRDGIRIRAAHFPATDADSAAKGTTKGTVLLFPGRTEYIEKYGRTASDLAERGFGTLVVDWRGQGLSERLMDDGRVGHVSSFADYQLDVAAVVDHARELELPRPWFLLGHSMGGCIGLRAVMERLPVQAAAFSAPMWGIQFSAAMRPAAWALSWGGARVGFGRRIAPGMKPESYVLTEPFDLNTLTTDREMFDYMQGHLRAQPDLQLGGPSLQWLSEALIECRRLAARPAPDLPCLAFLGSRERIVDPARIHDRMAAWPGGRLDVIDGAEHEVLMEDRTTRTRIADALAHHFAAAKKADAALSA